MLISQREAKQAGRSRGRAAASWMFDGNTSDETYRRFLQGLEDGDPMVLDAYAPPSWLSGEWAGESITELLGSADTQRELDRLEGVEAAYEEAADRAYWHELEWIARRQLGEPIIALYPPRVF